MERRTLFGKSAEVRELKHINKIGEGIIGPESRAALSKAGKFSLTPCSRDSGSIPGLGRSPGGNGPHSSSLTWEIPWTEEHSGYSPQGQKTIRHG